MRLRLERDIESYEKIVDQGDDGFKESDLFLVGQDQKFVEIGRQRRELPRRLSEHKSENCRRQIVVPVNEKAIAFFGRTDHPFAAPMSVLRNSGTLVQLTAQHVK